MEYKDVEVYLAQDLEPSKFIQIKSLLGSIANDLEALSNSTVGVKSSSVFVDSNTSKSVNGDFIVQGRILLKTPSNLIRGILSGGA